MKLSLKEIVAVTGLLALLTGCGSAAPPKIEEGPEMSQHALIGYPPLPAVGEDSPLSSVTPFGLYATPPSPATVASLAKGVTSFDGRYRAALTEQGAWTVRIDGGWFWQVELPPVVAPPTAPTGQAPPGQAAPPVTEPPPPPVPQTAASLGGWSSAGQLLIQSTGGAWFEANPLTATVTPLAPFWQGKVGLQVSPNDQQILYPQSGPKGPQVWVANRDGSRPTLVADNATAVWGPDNSPVVTKLPDPTTPPSTPAPPARSGS